MPVTVFPWDTAQSTVTLSVQVMLRLQLWFMGDAENVENFLSPVFVRPQKNTNTDSVCFLRELFSYIKKIQKQGQVGLHLRNLKYHTAFVVMVWRLLYSMSAESSVSWSRPQLEDV